MTNTPLIVTLMGVNLDFMVAEPSLRAAISAAKSMPSFWPSSSLEAEAAEAAVAAVVVVEEEEEEAEAEEEEFAASSRSSAAWCSKLKASRLASR